MLKFLKHNILTFYIYLLALRIKRKNTMFVFVASTGRCGTNTISNIVAKHPAFVSEHEPYPIVLSDNSEISDFDEKMLSIQKRKVITILRSATKPFYFEANHLFIKNFIREVIKFIPRDQIKIIHLQRDPVSVASSFYAIGSIPGVTERGKKYLLDPSSKDNLIRLSELGQEGDYCHDFYKCLWYWYEVEARVEHYMKAYPHHAWFELKTKQLNDKESIYDLISFLGIDKSEVENSLDVGRRDNTKSSEKKSLDDINPQEMHEHFVKLLNKHNLSKKADLKQQ
ncbi:hypothetical protein DXX93_00650 [Thalassotalea euphylliae]|uniref:Sulfotransferase domain-containing protein n=1 Tax=Thalassotalea euphylliae TaxID=1655234 RepID=A0A3E0TLR1_9GAMM|nr:sulfotransferase domain-containing protein [Thalassotalea euphylliae]REL25210.1 hypothetical protein DXX93_00650 [Thalassotalea euphylliae]